MIGVILISWWLGTKLDAWLNLKNHLGTVLAVFFGIVGFLVYFIVGVFKSK